MDQTARYFELSRRSREEFLQQAAPGALIRKGTLKSPPHPRATVRGIEESFDSTLLAAGLEDPLGEASAGAGFNLGIEVLPVAKKPGAPFSDMVTVGRTANNDIVINDVTVSRFHAYFKGASKDTDGRWVVCDAGSKNGSKCDGQVLDARKETPLDSGMVLTFGDVVATFYSADQLYDYLVSLDS